MEDFIKKLEQGDIIMFHGHGFIAKIISYLDQTNYSHCAIYDKDGFIYESVGKGMRRIQLEESVLKGKTALVTNYRLLNLPQEKTHLLIKNIQDNYYVKTYAHSQVLFLAGILLKKKINLNGFLETIYNYLFLFFGKCIEYFIDKKNVHMICSELVYRTYLDIAERENDSTFCLQIPIECSPLFAFEKNSHQLRHPCDINNLNKIKFNLRHKKKYLKTTNLEEEKKSINIFDTLFFSKKYLNNFEKLNLISDEQKESILKKKAPNVSEILKNSQLYNFISPGDIIRSFNIYPVNTHRTKLTEKYPNCNICNPN